MGLEMFLMFKIRSEHSMDVFVNFTMLAINLTMLVITLLFNPSLDSVPLLERAINRGLLVGNLAVAGLSFHWIYCKKSKFQKPIKNKKEGTFS